MSQSTYAHGQGEEITKFFLMRTAQKDGAFILPFIKPTSRILDVGSGPGSITCNFAEIASDGKVIGVDISPVAVEKAQNLAKSRGLSNIDFQTGDIIEGLPFADGEFDVVFCHQLLNHLPDPVKAIKEMKRLVKPGGVMAAREILEMVGYPDQERWRTFHYWHLEAIRQPEVKGHSVAENLPLYLQEAGFTPEKITFTMSGQMFFTREEKTVGMMGAHATLGPQGTLRARAIKAGAVADELDGILSDLERWVEDPAAWIAALSSEFICRQ